MDWTKIPTDLITNRTPDNEILAIVKYQLLWAELERQPDDKVALRYMTAKQLDNAQRWLAIIMAQVTSDIHSAEKNRTKRKINYNKIKSLDKNVSGTTTDTIPGNVSGGVLTKRREEKKREEIEKEYKYKGTIIKLNDKDYEDWKNKYNLLDLDYELGQMDLSLQTEKYKTKQKDWFFMVQGWLNKAQKKKKENKSDGWRGLFGDGIPTHLLDDEV